MTLPQHTAIRLRALQYERQRAIVSFHRRNSNVVRVRAIPFKTMRFMVAHLAIPI